jgi:hypothetical protein
MGGKRQRIQNGPEPKQPAKPLSRFIAMTVIVVIIMITARATDIFKSVVRLITTIIRATIINLQIWQFHIIRD